MQPDGTRLVASSWFRQVIAWDLESGDVETVKATIDLLLRWPDSAPVGALFAVGQNPAFRAAALRATLHEVIDDHTLQVTLTEPNTAFLLALTIATSWP